MRAIALWAVAVVALAGGLCSAKEPEARRDLAAALAEAKAQSKMLFVLFGRESCGNCQALKGYIRKRDVRLPEGDFVYADVDCDDPRQNIMFGQHFKVQGSMLPFVVVARSDGKQLAFRTGFGTPKDYEDMVHDAKRAAKKEAGEAAAASGKAGATGAVAAVAADAPRESRTWRPKGVAAFDAVFVKKVAGFVILRKADGKEVKVVSNSLSTDDQAYLRGMAGGKP